MKFFTICFTFLLACICTACSDNSKFVIKGTMTGNRTMNLRIVYPGNDNIYNVLTAARDGKFSFEGAAPDDGAIVQILDNDFRLMANVYVQNGQELSVKVDPQSPYLTTIKGNEVSERWCAWNKQNIKTLQSGNAVAVNALVEKYVKAHKNDILSTLLMVTTYSAAVNPGGATALMASINKSVRPDVLIEAWNAGNMHLSQAAIKAKVLPINYMDNKDSLRTFSTKGKRVSLLAFSDQFSGRRDSIIPIIKKIHARVNLLDMSTDPDTMSWRRGVRVDSVTWSTAWAPAALSAPGVERLGIPSIPFFIVADSLGQQVYRGKSVSHAKEVVDSLLNL